MSKQQKIVKLTGQVEDGLIKLIKRTYLLRGGRPQQSDVIIMDGVSLKMLEEVLVSVKNQLEHVGFMQEFKQNFDTHEVE